MLNSQNRIEIGRVMPIHSWIKQKWRPALFKVWAENCLFWSYLLTYGLQTCFAPHLHQYKGANPNRSQLTNCTKLTIVAFKTQNWPYLKAPF